MKYCSSCGAQMDDSASFCSKCGTPAPRSQAEYSRPQPNSYQQPYHDHNPKDRVAAALLALFLGTIGIQYFYMGKNKAGVICILISVLTCFVGAVILDVLFFIQGIIMLCGTQEEFMEKYVNTPKDFPLF